MNERNMHGGNMAIVGASETDEIGVVPSKSVLALHAEAARNALRDAGLSPSDVDGIATAGLMPMAVSHCLGDQPAVD